MAARKLTVVQVLPALESGGVERGTLEVGAELVRRGHRSMVISAGGRLVPELEAAGSEHIDWSVGRKSLLSLRHVPRLRRLLRTQRVDILHARSRLPAWIAYLAWRGMAVSARPHFVTTVHGFYSVGRYSAVMTKGERVIAVSEAIAKYTREHYDIDPQRITVIPRGVDRSQFPYGYQPSKVWLEQWYSEFPQTRERTILTLPGRITRLKGHRDFIHLIAALRQRGHAVHGLIVGGEHPRRRAYAQELRRMVEELGLESDITFTGTRADMREIYAISNLVLSLSSQPESFGRTVLEALSLGVAVVGYDHGGAGELLGRMYPGGRVKPGDATKLIEAVVQQMYQRSPVPDNHTFDLGRMLGATISVYESLVGDHEMV